MRPDLQPAMFYSATGSAFVYIRSLPYSGELLYRGSDDGSFYELEILGRSGPWNDSRLTFRDLHSGLEGRLERRGDVVSWGNVEYHRQDFVEYDREKVVPLPNTRRIQDLMELPDGRLVCVHSRRYGRPTDGYSYYRLHVAKLGEPTEAVVIINPGVRANSFYAELSDGSRLWMSYRENESHLGNQSLVPVDNSGQFEIIVNDDGTSTIIKKPDDNEE